MDKRMGLQEAAALLEPGQRLAMGGITLYRRPMAFALALYRRFLRQGQPGDLELLSFTGGLETDLLISAGMVRAIRSCYVGLEGFGLAPHFTQAAQRGELQIIEETEASLALGMRAAMAGVGFMPSRAWSGTDMFQLRPDVRQVVDPYSGELLTAFPALRTDVAVIHALQVDEEGNALLGKNLGVDRELPLVAERVIITTEEIVPSLERADIVGLSVDAVIHVPQGAWPSSCHPLYPMDGAQVLAYVEAAGKQDFARLIASWCDRFGL
jgi:glutaconate CoA-transferase subunit A